MSYRTYALMAAGQIYTLRECGRDPFTGKKPDFKYQGYCDGEPFMHFKSKKDFERFVSMIPDTPPQDWKDDQLAASRKAMYESESHGKWVLGRLVQRLTEQQLAAGRVLCRICRKLSDRSICDRCKEHGE